MNAAARRRGFTAAGARELVLLGAGVAVLIAGLREHPLNPATVAIGIGLLVGPAAVGAGGGPPKDPGGSA